MRRHGVHSAELARIEKWARESMVESFREERRKKDHRRKLSPLRICRLKEALNE